jgi:hypothetical protein
MSGMTGAGADADAAANEDVMVPTALSRPFDGPVAEPAESTEPVVPVEVLCAAVYDAPFRGGVGEHHDCDLPDDHEGRAHHCTGCGRHWMARLGVLEPSGAAQEQVNAARRDARGAGRGFVAITVLDGSLVYERIAPERVMVKAEKQKDGAT